MRLCFVIGAFRGGLFGSIFSWALLDELAVGRIILARNPSSGGLEPIVLARDLGRSAGWDTAGNDGREDFFCNPGAVLAVGTKRDPAVGRSFF